MSEELRSAPRAARVRRMGITLKTSIIRSAIEKGVPKEHARAFADAFMKNLDPTLKEKTQELQNAIQEHLEQTRTQDQMGAEKVAAKLLAGHTPKLDILKSEIASLTAKQKSRAHSKALGAIEREKKKEIEAINAAFRKGKNKG